jgi:hypothetical protein
MKKKLTKQQTKNGIFDLIKNIPEAEIQAAIDRAYAYWTDSTNKPGTTRKPRRKRTKR